MTADFQVEAYQQVIPGTSTDADIAKFLKQKMSEYGVKDGLASDQNPNVNFQAWKLADETEKTISVDEMAVVTIDGASYLIDSQEELILINNKN